MPVIGLLSSASSRDYAPMIAAFLKSLGEAGFIEGRNVKIEYVWADDSMTVFRRWLADVALDSKFQPASLASGSEVENTNGELRPRCIAIVLLSKQIMGTSLTSVGWFASTSKEPTC